MNKKELFNKYADLKTQIKALTSQAKEMEGEVKQEMIDSEFDTIKIEAGTFFLTARKKWTYSPTYLAMEKDLKDKLDVQLGADIREGTATSEDTKILSFRN